MKIFQVIIILALVFLFILYRQRFHQPAMDKIFVFLLLLTGIVFAINPGMTNRLANLLGIGRGADLIFYLAILGFGYVALILYSKINRLENQLTELARKQALSGLSQQQESHD